MTNYEKERDEKAVKIAEKFRKKRLATPETFQVFLTLFKAGSDWTNARAEKRIQVLEEDLYESENAYEHAHESAKAYALKCGRLQGEIDYRDREIKTLEAKIDVAREALDFCANAPMAGDSIDRKPQYKIKCQQALKEIDDGRF